MKINSISNLLSQAKTFQRYSNKLLNLRGPKEFVRSSTDRLAKYRILTIL